MSDELLTTKARDPSSWKYVVADSLAKMMLMDQERRDLGLPPDEEADALRRAFAEQDAAKARWELDP
jgi:hypothetical protein